MAVAVIATVVLLAQHHVGTVDRWTVLAVGGRRRRRRRAVDGPRGQDDRDAATGQHLQRRRRRRRRAAGDQRHPAAPATPASPTLSSITGALDILIGVVTFTGSLVAAGKLQGWIPGRPLDVPRLAGAQRGAGGRLPGRRGLAGRQPGQHRRARCCCSPRPRCFGVTMVLPIGGADMPVVISLLNAFTGTAVAMAGFVHRQAGADHRRSAGRRGRGHPHQADGRRDEPVDRGHHGRRLRHRRQRPSLRP